MWMGDAGRRPRLEQWRCYHGCGQRATEPGRGTGAAAQRWVPTYLPRQGRLAYYAHVYTEYNETLIRSPPPPGLGNQIFQHLFGRLLAASLGWESVHTPLAMDEVPWNENHLPPNSLSGVSQLKHLLRVPVTTTDSLAPSVAARCATNVTLSDRPWDVRKMKVGR